MTDEMPPDDAAAAEAEALAEAGEPSPGGLPVELYLLRHADAGDPDAWKGDDAERPLSPKGRKQARRVGRWLAHVGRRPDAIITSPKARALETATIVAACVDMKPAVDRRLGEPLDHAALDAIIAAAGSGAKRVIVVGHDPDFSSMASSLTGAPITLKKGALARIDLDGDSGPERGVLRWLIPAEAVPER
jgi:phosphohistidine phosphatase